MIAALSLALLSGLGPQSVGATPAALTRGHVEGWTYEVKTDAFTGSKACKLYGRDHKTKVTITMVGGGALAFQLGHHLKTEDAIYRVDGAPARASRDDKTVLILSDVAVPDLNLNQNEATGLVIIPLATLAGAQQVTIRPDVKHAPVAISLAGLGAVVAAARAQGCAPSSFSQLDIPE